MALGNVRATAEFQSDRGRYYKIEIYDEDWTGASESFNVDGDGFQLKYDGNGKNRWFGMMASTLSFTFFVENATHNTFMTEIATRDQGKIRVKVLTGTTSTPTDVFWVGTVLPDVGNFTDESFPTKHKLVAVDGLSLLKGIAFDRDVYQTDDFLYTFLNVIQNMLVVYTNTNDFFGATDNFVKTMVGWEEDTMNKTSITIDPLVRSAIQPRRAFIDVSNEGQDVSVDAYTVLEQICKCWGARIFQADGIWNFIQPDVYEQQPTTGAFGFVIYRKSGSTVNSSGSFNEAKAIDDTNIYYLAGRTTKYMTPFRTVKMEYDKWGYGVFSGVFPLKRTGDPSSAYQELGYVENDILVNITMTNNAIITQTSGTLVNDAFAYLHVFVKSVADDGTTVYLQEDYTYGASESYIVVPVNQYGNGFSPGNQIWAPDTTEVVNTEAGFVTTQAGVVSLKFEFQVVDEYTNAAAPDQSLFSATDLEFSGVNQSGIYYLQDNTYYYNETVTTIARIFKSSQGTGNTVFDMGKCRLGDGPLTSSKGRIRISNGSSFSNSVNESWSSYGTGNEVRITQLAVRDFLAGQDKFLPMTFMTLHWTTTQEFSFIHSYTHDSTTWVPQGGTYTATKGMFKSEFWEAYQSSLANIGAFTNEVITNYTDDSNPGFGVLEAEDIIESGH